jgi:type IV pilus assembly protein PilY1
MMRAIFVVVILLFSPLVFLPGDVSGGSTPCSNSLVPPFLTSAVLPNILIILDNSNSMDEDFYGNAVGSYSPASKSVVERQAMQQIITGLQGKANVGVMTFTLPGDVTAYDIYNAMPFASFNPPSYCPNPHPDPSDPLYIATWPPAACQTYCMSGDSTAQAACEAACPGLTTTQYEHYYQGNLATSGPYNGLMTTGFPDLIIDYYSPTTDPTSTRARYCNLAYPKTQKLLNSTDPQGGYVYYNQTDPMYLPRGWCLGTQFGYSGYDDPYQDNYSPAENATINYYYCYDKTIDPPSSSAEDIWTGFSNCDWHTGFVPTDSDWALGFANWGQQMPFYYAGPTWFSSTSLNNNSTPQGYLNVPVGSLTDATQYSNVMNILSPNVDATPFTCTSEHATNYMSCAAANNSCPYIINAGNTPTAGALLAALNYFNGTFTQNGKTFSNPVTASCQQNYIIFATDGLPDTKLDGTQPGITASYCYNSAGQTAYAICQTTSNCSAPYNAACTTPVVGEVIGELSSLQTNNIKTYFLGLGLTALAKTNLDMMATAGGTASSGHAYYADNPTQFYDSLEAIVTDLLGRVAAGSAVSILSEGQSQNSFNMLQGVFYPDKYFGSETLFWPGYLYNFWFYDTANYSNMREDTVHDYILELNEDYGIAFSFSDTDGLMVNRYSDPTGSGNPTQAVNPPVTMDGMTPLWEAGKLLFATSASSRTIYTPGSSSSGLVSFNTSNTSLTGSSSPLGNPSNFDSCLNGSLSNLINYVTGTDIGYCYDGTSFNYSQPCTQNSQCTTAPYTTCQLACRSRTVGLCSDGAGNFSNTPCGSSGDCTTPPYTSCVQNTWKLGDIVYSTPKVQADYKYCYNGSSYNSQTCSQDSDCTAGSTCQKKESVIFVGANDGMLHAFETGTINTTGLNASQYQVAQLTGIPTSAMGSELWAFIPKNSLPYLRCLAAPPPNSCHLYYSDLTPYITTMVSNGVSRTVLIGGMRLGGGSITSGQYCFNSSGVGNGQTCSQNSDCATAPYTSCSTTYYLNVPSDTCSASLTTTTTLHTAASLCADPSTCYSPTNCTGLSSYYALDITDAENPKLLWEFSHPLLGYTYSGPAIIHKWSDPSTLTGDQYYVMFSSGPTNPNDGSSVQDVQVFVLSLNANMGISSVYYKDLGLSNGFGGRLFTNGLDINKDGYTDFVFFGYANSPTQSATGWQGGIAKINTNNTDPTAALSPQNWTYDVSTYSSIAQLPITTQVAAEQCFNMWYLYAGTGRYFFPMDNYEGSAHSGLNYIMGIPFSCDQYNSCPSTVTSLGNSSAACANRQQGAYSRVGWMDNMDPATAGSYGLERMTTDPTVSANNMIFLTTSEPTADACKYGGRSRVWGLNCATGSALTDTSCTGYTVSQNLVGNLYLQTSTGAINQVNINTGNNSAAAASSFNFNNNMTTQWFVGMPPETSPPLFGQQQQNKTGQLIQWMEK